MVKLGGPCVKTVTRIITVSGLGDPGDPKHPLFGDKAYRGAEAYGESGAVDDGETQPLEHRTLK